MATVLPTGVLTFLFTDVVDSTAMWEKAPDLMEAALARHDAIIEKAVLDHGGLLLKHKGEGDSTFCVFVSAADAVAGAVSARRALTQEPWHERARITVRMGLHSGESILRGRDYFGRTINRAARVRAVAVGDQIVLSGAAALLAGSGLPESVDVRFLRRAVLKGIDGAEEIYELVDAQVQTPADDEVTSQVPLPSVLSTAVPAVFVGRSDHLERIEQARRRADGGAQLVLLGGEPGAGKSTLAAIAARSAHDAGYTVLFGSCSERTETLFEPFRHMLEHYVRAAPRDLLADHVSAHGGEVGRLTSALRTRMGDISPVEQLDPETTRSLLEDAIIDLLERVASCGPLMLVFDDLQWADATSLALLSRLNGTGASMTVVCTYRSAEAPHLAALRSGRSLNGTTDDLHVTGLSNGEVLELLETYAGRGLGQTGIEVAAYLSEQTGGNPFFLAQLLRHFVETGLLTSDSEAGWVIGKDLQDVSTPGTVTAVVGQRLERLGTEAARILEVASVVGQRFDSRLVAHVLTADELDVVDAIEAAITASLVREIDVDTFEFSHALVRDSLYDGLGHTRRALRHEQCGRAMEELYGKAVSASGVASHCLRSNSRDNDRLVRWARLAGRNALDDLSPEDALQWFGHALEALDSDRSAERLELLIDIAPAQRWVDSDVFRTTMLEAGELAEQLADEAAFVRVVLANNRGGASRSGAVDEARVASIERALEIVGSEVSPDRARLLGTLAIELSQRDDPDLVNAIALEAVECAEQADDEVALLTVLLHTTEATRIPATFDQRMADGERVLDLAVRVGDPRLRGLAAVRDVRLKIEAAAFDEVGPSMAVIEEFGHLDPYVGQNLLSLRAVLAHVNGDTEAALGHAAAAREAMRGEVDGEAVYMATTSFVLWDRGQLGSLLPTIEATVRRYPAVTGFQAVLAAAYCDVDDFDSASQILSQSTSNGFADHSMNPLWMLTMSMFASVCIDVGDVQAATMIYDLLDPFRGRANSAVVAFNGLVSESLAGLALVAGNLPQAERDAVEALAQAEKVGAPISAVRTRLIQCRVLVDRGGAEDLDRAIVLAHRVAEDASEFSLATVHRRAEELMTSLRTAAS